MPAIAEKSKTKRKNGKEVAPKVIPAAPKFEPKAWFFLAISGALLGLSAPGFDQWYVAWFGLVPLLIGSVSSPGKWQAFFRGLAFGTAYNLVYFNWLLGLQPLDWLSFNVVEGWLLASFAWIFVAVQQGLAVGLFSVILSVIPLSGSFLAQKSQGQWKAPALLAVPLLWVLVNNFIGTAHCLTGVPWSMLEYSQYKQVSFIQIASIIGGIGLGFLIVMANTSLAALIGTIFKKRQLKSIAAADKTTGFYQILATISLLTGVLGYGFYKTANAKFDPNLNVSVLQGNINIEMQKTVHRYTLHELLEHYTGMLSKCPKGLVVWTESALPTYLKDEPGTCTSLLNTARGRDLDMVVGSMDHDGNKNPFNSAYGITSGGHLLTETYHKRFLVPYGEYTPLLVRDMPEWMRRLTNTPAGGGFESGKEPVALSLNCGKVAPLICFETLAPELVASSVRKGGQLLVNVSDLAWFHKSMIGHQMIAFSVLRAVENNRYFVFAANTGPSAIIDPTGRITHRSGLNEDRVLTGKVQLSSKLTPFTSWFVF